MSNDAVMTVTVKGIGDFSDVVSNVGSVQKALTKLKLPDKLGDNLSKNITNFYKEYEKYQKKISEGVKTQGDYNQVEKSLNNMRNLYQAIGKDAQKLTQLDMKDMLNLDTNEFKKISNEITNIVKQIGSVKIDTNAFTKAFADIRNVTKNSKISGEDGLLNQIIGHINTGQIAAAKKELQELQNYANKVAPRETASGKHAPGTLSPEKYQQLTAAINSMNGAVAQAEATMNPLIEKENQLQKELEETKQKAAQGIAKEFKGYNQASGEVEKLTDSLKRMHQEEFSFNREAQNIDRQIQSYFGLSQMIRKVGDIARDAFATVKELDKAMTETAVVTNFSVGDMWDMLPTYTQQANQLGSTIRDVYEAATLYYQQGLNTNQAMSLANETLKMARIAGLDAAEATNMMTAALRGFNMEINQQSAQKINDIYSELAAITASDTKEIGSAMERTASIANSANMEFATTSAFLAQMIETTREAPENLGTAMKTIIARFQEMKQDPTKLVDSEGVAMDANKVDKALKTIGVNLMNTKGEFRDLDDVFLDISQKWDSLTQGQQRYIATIAAGSRQQSRFIAMMSNYERTMELVDAANNSAGASQRQFEKTLDSMEAKLNKLKNAWDQFTMGLMNNQILKFSVDALTEGFTIVNKFIDILGRIPPKPFEGITKSALTLVTTLGMLNLGKKASRGLVMGGAGWFKGEKGFLQGFSEGWGNKNIEARRSGTQTGMTWSQFAAKAINSSSGEIKQAMHNAMQFSQVSGPVAIENELRSIFQGLKESSNNFGLEGHKSADRYIEAILDSIRNGERSIRSAIEAVFARANHEATEEEMAAIEQQIQAAAKSPVDFDKTSTDFENLTQSATKAGTAIQQFGFALQGTPLEGFGNTLIKIGQLMDSTATLAKTLGKKLGDAFKAAQDAEAGKGISTFFKTLLPGLTKLIKAHPILAAIVAIITAIGVAAMAVAHHNKKAFETIQNAAAKASEAYDSAKQETSELADAIEQIKTNEDAFDGLVAGTAAFNEQLVTANQQIMELITKYPMLNDPKYLSTDKNGLMHINDEGLNAVKEYQKQLQANASALNLIQAADLNSAEVKQKTKQMRKTKGTDTLESLAQRKQEADLIEQQAEAQQQMAKLNAVNTALVNKEIGNREKVSAILADQYDARREAISLEGESIHDLKQEYADFYGYKYDKSTKKLTDIEGNEIDVDKDTIKDAVKDIRILTDIEVDGKSLDNMINHIDSAFSQGLGESFKDSEHLFSDILSDNININDDLLKEILQNPDKLQTAVDSLTEKEIAAVLGVSADAVEQAPDKYKDELTNKLTEKATNIAETQAQSYADLATMMAQTVGTSVIDGNGEVIAKISEEQKTTINEQLSKLTSEQKNMLSSIGTVLQEGAGTDSMRTFIKQATDIYTSGAEDAITDLDNIIQGVNWDSPTARLKAYNDMIADGVDSSVQQLGQDLLNSTDSANLLGEAFEEFYDSNEFQEMAENMDKFADSSGKLNASSIQEMAKECGSLNNLLDSGAISAGGVAAALNAMGANGNITILDLNENLLKFLSTANQLDDVLSEAHSLIENFNWGIDTGESEDFAKDSTKKWKELYDNGEFGNQQLENYAKFVLGQERWNDELEDAGGNIETALANMDKDISIYSDGFMDAWRQMADSGTYVEGEVGIHRGENNDIIWETQGKTTEELVDWLADTRGITKEWAKLMVEDFANYSYDFKTELANNDYVAALKNGDYIEAHKGADNTTNITQSEVAALAAAQNKTEEEILKDIQKYGKISEDQLNIIKNIDENGNLLMGSGDIESFNTQYSQAELGKDTTKSWISQYEAKTPQGEKIEGSTELKSAISAAIADGFASEQATEMARVEALEAFKEGAKVFYDGVELNKEDLEDSQAFAERVAEITENSRWNAVGEAIAQGYISYIKGNEDLSNSSENWTSAKDGGDKSPTESIDWDSGTDADIALREEMRAKARENWSQLWASIKNAFTSGTPIEDPKAAAAEQSKENWKEIWAKVKEAFTSGEGVEDPKIEAANKAKENWKSLWDKVKEVFSNNPDINIDPKVNKGKPNKEEGTTETTGDLAVSYTGKVANPEELKASLEQQITTLLNSIASQQSKMKATATVNVKQGTIEKPKAQKAVVNYTKGKQAKAEAQTANVNYELGKQEAPKTKTATVNYTLGSVPSVPTQYATLKLTLSEDSKRFNVVRAATGMNNIIPYSPTPTFGSAAKGRYGTVGPKNKGGLTLTGEEGFEIAWLPSESRSVILGTKGPQLTNLPADAVVYTHKQSKKIVKQKAIPAGSHAGRHDPPAGGSGGGGGGGKGSTPKTSQTTSSYHREITKILTKGGKVSVWWENIARMAETRERAAAKTQKKFDKLLQTFGTTATKAEKVADTYRADLQKVIDVNKKQVNKANGELKYLDKKGKASISYQVTKKKGSKKTTETKKETVNIGKFIKQMEDGTYIIDQKAITKIAKKNKAKAEAIKQAIEQRLNDKISKRNKALDEIEKAQDKLAEISNNIYDTFYRWEFSLNKIYFLAQKLSSLTGQMDYRQSREELISNRVLAGYGPATATDQISQLLNVLEEEKKLMIDQVEENIANAEATKEAYLNSIDFKTYTERYEKAPDNEHAEEDIKAAKWALRLIEEGGNFDESQIEKLKNQGYNEYTINQIKEVLDDIDQKRKDALQASTDANASINTIYNKIVEYESYISEFEADLLTGIEEQTEKEINRLDKLNSSLSKAYKDLLDEVKRALDERRKREDNAKTERDIAQKQQRLAALRADTSGGHQVEIAQLEKEIAEAQQNYQRTLEDQLLENLQNQGDKAEKQRQQQIELLQAQKEIAQQTGTNLLQVQEWLKDPEKNKEQIRAAWLANRGYDDMTERQKASAEREFDEAWMKYGAYLTEVADLREVASNTKFESIDGSVKLGQIAGDVEKIANQVIDTKATGGIGWSSFKAAGGTAEQARELGALASSVQSVWGTKETFNAGYTKKALTEAGITVKDLHQVGIKAGALNKRGYKVSELKDYYSIKELAEGGYSYSELRKIYKDSQIKKALNANLAKSIGVPDKTIAKWYGSKAALKAGAGGAAVQSANKTGLQTQQKIVNESKKDKATQSSLAGISTKLDTNGKKKGGKINATVNASGKSVTGNKGSTLYTRKIDTKTGKLTGDVTTTKIADLSTADFTKNKKEATDALIYAIKHREVGSKISSKMKSLVSAAGIAGKTYKLKNNVTASIGADGKIYYATKDAVKIWNASTGKVDVDKYNKNEYLKKAQKNNSVSREYAQALINRNAFTKPQLQKKGVKKFAAGGLASYTGPAWLDGTPSKPELVLNPTDTKNFLALRDVLDKAIGSANSVTNSYGGNATYEININVDKIEKDYDVDRVAERVKKIIVKDSGYRNVTQVRNFR